MSVTDLDVIATVPVTAGVARTVDASLPRPLRPRISPGNISIRIAEDLHHIGLGRNLDGTRIVALINGYDVRVINAATGEIIRTLMRAIPLIERWIGVTLDETHSVRSHPVAGSITQTTNLFGGSFTAQDRDLGL